MLLAHQEFRTLRSFLPQNLDNQERIPNSDSDVEFYLGNSPQDRQATLYRLLASWHSEPARQDVKELVRHLEHLVQARTTHVGEWLTSNTSRFQADNPDIRGLKRDFERLSEALKANTQLCLMECNSCRLPCLRSKSHEAFEHECGTSHECTEACDFLNDHEEDGLDQEKCGLP